MKTLIIIVIASFTMGCASLERTSFTKTGEAYESLDPEAEVAVVLTPEDLNVEYTEIGLISIKISPAFGDYADIKDFISLAEGEARQRGGDIILLESAAHSTDSESSETKAKSNRKVFVIGKVNPDTQ
jgi:hypothetical protein